MTRVGIGSYALAWGIGIPGYPPPKPLDVFGFVELAATLDVPLVQIADNLPLQALSAAELDRLVDLTCDLGIDVEVGTRGIEPGGLRRYLEFAERLGSPILRVVIDTEDHRPSVKEATDLLRGVLPAFEAAGVTLAIENHDRFKARTLAAIVRDLGNPNVGICLDTANSFGALEGPEIVLAELGPLTVNLHVKDFVVEREGHNLGFRVRGAPAGRGMLDIPAILTELRRFGCDVDAILESWPPPEATIEETIAKERAWLEESVAYVRGLVGGPPRSE